MLELIVNYRLKRLEHTYTQVSNLGNLEALAAEPGFLGDDHYPLPNDGGHHQEESINCSILL